MEDMNQFLKETRLLNYNHSSIQKTVKKVTHGLTTDREKAVAIHKFVKNEIKFGFGAMFWDYTADEVLSQKVGFCNTKSTLFAAMLRSVGIPTRQHVVGLNSAILDGYFSTGGKWVDHSWTEVYLDNKWIATDSYIIDDQLYQKASKALKSAQGSPVVGYGIHINGRPDWDGASDGFVQCCPDSPSDFIMTQEDFGTFQDMEEFYEKHSSISHNYQSWGMKLVMAPFLLLGSSKIDSFRKEE